ncbi:alpha/beta hydrolase [Ulvibacterium sp.]|uniref:alpha/beta fold hydrolase n=1 Tax=Ulvibacterium sp. TaxID=2665914 RepID=UPI00262C2F36|nr:alpha/beta hydrolase [Ulvibacterium sp.]
MKKLLLILVALLVGQGHAQKPNKTEIVNVNGIELYYEQYGKGEPLLLLHGWTQSSQFWSEYISTYAQSYEVYVVDLRGHGKTTPLTKDFSIQKSANDIIALTDYLSLKGVKAIGLSYGGLVLLQIGGLLPDRLESVILIGASHNYSGGDNKALDNQFTFDDLPPSFVEQLRELHPQGDQQIRALFNPNLNYEIRLEEEDLMAMRTRTLVINGDRDEILGVDAALALHKNLPDSELWIIPNSGHIPIDGTNKSQFLDISIEFLNRKKAK